MSSPSIEFIPPDYVLAYSSLARRVSAAYVHLDHCNGLGALDELRAAMAVINKVENTTAVLTVQE